MDLEPKDDYKLTPENILSTLSAFEAGYFEHSADFKTGTFNSEWPEVLGFSTEKIPDLENFFSWWGDRLHPADREEALTKYEDLLEGHIDQFSMDYRFRDEYGCWRWIHSVAKALNREKEKSRRRIGMISEDVTECKQREEFLLRAREKAEHANQAKGEFLSNACHEIRTPLHIIIGMTELLSDARIPDKERRHIKMLKTAGERLIEHLNNTLELSRAEAGELVLERGLFNLHDLLDEIVEVMRFHAGQRDLSLSITMDDEIPSMVLGDPSRLRQVLINLLANAIKFTPRGEIRLLVEPERKASWPGVVRFTVSDDGIGIPETKLKSIFAPFTQAGPCTTRRFGGSGLGLAIARQLVELMGGRIWVDSREGVGSSFYFTACLTRQQDFDLNPPPMGPHLQHSDRRKHGLSILMVEESEQDEIIIRSFLKYSPHRIKSVSNSLDALQRIRTGHFQLILIDLQMGGHGGPDLVSAIRDLEERSQRIHIPIIALADEASGAGGNNLTAKGINSLLVKPFNRARLIKTIDQVTVPIA